MFGCLFLKSLHLNKNLNQNLQNYLLNNSSTSLEINKSTIIPFICEFGISKNQISGILSIYEKYYYLYDV